MIAPRTSTLLFVAVSLGCQAEPPPREPASPPAAKDEAAASQAEPEPAVDPAPDPPAVVKQAPARPVKAVRPSAPPSDPPPTMARSVPAAAAPERVGVQWVTTTYLLDDLAKAKARSPHLPASRPLFHRVDKAKKNGTTVQHPWGGEGANKFMRVRVRKVYTTRIQHDQRDCLTVPLVGSITFPLEVLPHSVLKFAPEYVRLGGPAGATMQVVAVVGDEQHVLWSDKRRGSSLWRDRWEEVTIKLDRFANQTIGLRFEIDHERLGDKRWTRGGRHRGVGLWALPRVLTRLRTEDRELRRKVKAKVGDEMNHSVIMFVFDSLRADLVPPVRDLKKRIPSLTPHLDKFVAGGIGFEQAFSVGNQTRTGSYALYMATPPSVHGSWQTRWTYSDKTRRDFYGARPETIGRVLHRAGYLTGHLGYNSFLFGNLYLALDMGFDFVSEFNGVPKNTVNMTEGIIEWLRAHKDEKFFLLVWYDPPHFPYVAPKGYKKRVYEAGVPRDMRYFSHGFLAKLMYGDDYFGKLWKEIETLGLPKKTLFVLTADHGEAMDPRHDGYSNNVDSRIARMHGKTFYDEEIHVPLVFRLDGVLPKGKAVKNQVSLMSLAPTLQELLGLPTNLKKQYGKSFAKLVRGKKEKDERVVYFEGRWSYGIRWDGYKYIFHDYGERMRLNRKSLFQRRRDGTDELFDLRKDPDELTSVVHEQPDALKRLKKKYFETRDQLRAFRKQVFEGDVRRPLVDLPKDRP